MPKFQLASDGKVAIFGVVLFASVLVYMIVFSTYKGAFNRHQTLMKVSQNPNAIVVTSEQAKEIFKEHNIEHPMINSEEPKKKQVEAKKVQNGDFKQFSSDHIQ